MFSHVYVSLHSHALALDENDIGRLDWTLDAHFVSINVPKTRGENVKKMSQKPWVEGERYFIINALQTPLPY